MSMRRYLRAAGRWGEEVLSGVSRTLNAVLGGDGAVTFSARVWDAARRGSRVGHWLAAAIDLALRWKERDHCRLAWEWHQARGLLGRRAVGAGPGEDGLAQAAPRP